jgi:hypothetical protein
MSWLAGWRYDHIWIQWTVKGITCKKVRKHDLLKIKLFLTCHIAVRIAQTPTLIFLFSDLTIPFSQVPNMCTIITRGVILKAM